MFLRNFSLLLLFCWSTTNLQTTSVENAPMSYTLASSSASFLGLLTNKLNYRARMHMHTET